MVSGDLNDLKTAARASGKAITATSSCTLRMVFMELCEDEHMTAVLSQGVNCGEVEEVSKLKLIEDGEILICDVAAAPR